MAGDFPAARLPAQLALVGGPQCEARAAVYEELRGYILDGRMHAEIEATYPLEQIKEAVAHALPATQPAGECIGKPLPNPDARAKITGEARYTDDYRFPGMLFARTKRAGTPRERTGG